RGLARPAHHTAAVATMLQFRVGQAISLPQALLLLIGSVFADNPVSIRLENGAYRVSGWDASHASGGEWMSIFSVYAGEGDVPPMLGTYAVENGSLVFRPRFAPSPGVRSRAVLRLTGRPPIEAVFESPAADLTPTTRVEHVYPSVDLLPDN